MDTLSRVLDTLHFGGTFYFATSFHSPWSIEVPQYKNVARFHYVTQGTLWIRIEGEDTPQRLSSGDLVIIPHGLRHILSDSADREPISLDAALDLSQYSGEGLFEFGDGDTTYSTRLVCGHFEFSESFNHPMISQLPSHIVKHEGDGIDFSWMKDTLKFLSHMASSQRAGSSAMVKRLSEVIFIQTVRFWSSKEASQKSFLSALNDPHISKGLKAFHDRYADDWSVEKLARESNMSRSLFAERFKQSLDMSPMQYVSRWRMENARQLLITSDQSIDAIALAVGYESAAAFSKAFKRHCQLNPGQYRRESRELEPETID